MVYEVKYRDMEKSVDAFYKAAKRIDNCTERLANVRRQVDYAFFGNDYGYKEKVGSRAKSVDNLSITVVQTGQCIDNARIEYLLAEQMAYKLISGDESFEVGKGINPVSVPNLKGYDDRNLFQKVIGVGKAAVKWIGDTSAAFAKYIRYGGEGYQAWKVVTGAVQIVSGVAKIAASVSSFLVTFGVSSGASAIGIVSGINEYYTGIMNFSAGISNNYFPDDDILSMYLKQEFGEEVGGIASFMFNLADLNYNVGEMLGNLSKLTKFPSYVKWFYDFATTGFDGMSLGFDFVNDIIPAFIY
jgi:predicted phage tail protein